jgi:hypothetical protein
MPALNRRWFRFSLRGLLVAVTLVAIGAAIARSPERREIAGLVWAGACWGLLCYAVIRVAQRKGSKPDGSDAPVNGP